MSPLWPAILGGKVGESVSISQMRKLRQWEVRVTRLVKSQRGFKTQWLEKTSFFQPKPPLAFRLTWLCLRETVGSPAGVTEEV